MAIAMARNKQEQAADSRLGKVLHALRADPGLALGLVMVLLVIVCTVFAPLLTPYGYNDQNIRNRLKPGFWSAEGTPEHPLGTDGIGRDLWSRLVYSYRSSLAIGVSAVVLSLLIGLTVGLISGTMGGWVEALLMRLTEVQMALPFIVLALTVLSMSTPTVPLIVVVLSLSSWPTTARLVRSATITERQSDYVTAARAMGASTPRIIVQYVARNILTGLLITSIINLGTMMVLEATLSFIGIGVQPPVPSFGNIVADGKVYITQAWWVTTFPGIAVLFAVLGLNLVGDSLHKYLDPRMRTQV